MNPNPEPLSAADEQALRERAERGEKIKYSGHVGIAYWLNDVSALLATLDAARAERDALRKALEELGGYAMTCLPKNTPEWMAGLQEHIMKADAVLNKGD